MKTVKYLFIMMLGAGLLLSVVQCKPEQSVKVNDPYTKKYINADFYRD